MRIIAGPAVEALKALGDLRGKDGTDLHVPCPTCQAPDSLRFLGHDYGAVDWQAVACRTGCGRVFTVVVPLAQTRGDR